jgi:hypothetical protein
MRVRPPWIRIRLPGEAVEDDLRVRITFFVRESVGSALRLLTSQADPASINLTLEVAGPDPTKSVDRA